MYHGFASHYPANKDGGGAPVKGGKNGSRSGGSKSFNHQLFHLSEFHFHLYFHDQKMKTWGKKFLKLWK